MAVASASPLPAALSSKPTARSTPPLPAFLPLRTRVLRAARLGPVVAGRRFLAEAIKTQREKEQTEVAVEESFPIRETAPPEGAEDPLVPTEESWVVKLEQSVNIFLTIIYMMYLSIYEMMGQSIARR